MQKIDADSRPKDRPSRLKRSTRWVQAGASTTAIVLGLSLAAACGNPTGAQGPETPTPIFRPTSPAEKPTYEATLPPLPTNIVRAIPKLTPPPDGPCSAGIRQIEPAEILSQGELQDFISRSEATLGPDILDGTFCFIERQQLADNDSSTHRRPDGTIVEIPGGSILIKVTYRMPDHSEYRTIEITTREGREIGTEITFEPNPLRPR